MTKEQHFNEKRRKLIKQKNQERAEHHATESESGDPLTRLQKQVGNRAVQRLLAQRKGSKISPASTNTNFELDDETTDRINRERGAGKPLDSAVQKRMSAAMGHDFSGVQVHASQESDDLNRQLKAKAFTTGQDIFFRERAYDPHSSGGQELIAHELTHVVQQTTGAVSGDSGMTVNAPDDAFEREADSIAKTALSAEAGADVQRQPIEEEEEELQMQELEDEEEEELLE